MTNTARVFDLSLGQMLWSRRTIFLALVTGAPVALGVVWRVMQASGVSPVRVNGVQVGGDAVFGLLMWVLFVRFIVPVLGVFYGTALIADEVEDKTLTYLFTRPIQRGAVLMGKYLAYFLCTALVVLPAVVIVFFLLMPVGEVGSNFIPLVKDLGILAIGLAVYGAVFAFIGALLRRPLLAGLIFAFGWEQVALIVPGYLRQFTVAHYLQALVPHAMPSNGPISMLERVFRDVPSPAVSLLGLAVLLAASLFLAIRTVERREYVLDQ